MNKEESRSSEFHTTVGITTLKRTSFKRGNNKLFLIMEGKFSFARKLNFKKIVEVFFPTKQKILYLN